MVDPKVCPPEADVELADVIRRFGPEYVSQYGQGMMPSQKRALSDIAACCTPELGGQLYRCDDCDDTFWRYHCCRNRACPKCHASRTQQWLEQSMGSDLHGVRPSFNLIQKPPKDGSLRN